MLESRICVVCGGTRLRTLARRTYRRPARETDPYARQRLDFLFERLVPGSDEVVFTLKLCRECGMVFSNPRLTAGEMAEKYAYLDRRGDPEGTTQPLRTAERAERVFRFVSDSLGGPPASLRVLDYGGSWGFNLAPFTRDNRCFLVDYVRRDLVGGVEYLGRDLDDLEGGPPFDVILLSHTLEHASLPVELLHTLTGHLAGGGLAYVEVPLGVFRDWLIPREPLTHVNFFSEQSLGACMTRAGLAATRVSTQFEWVTRYRSWCINAAGEPGADGARVGLRGSRSQMRDPRYYAIWGFDRLKRRTRPGPQA